MRYLLDTNIIGYWMRGDRQVIAKIRQVSPDDLRMAAITYAEIQYGIRHAPQHQERRFQKLKAITDQVAIAPFDRSTAEHYGEIRDFLEKQRQTISERDLQIAATARSHNWSVVTHNTREFTRVPNLEVEDWAAV